MLRFLLTAYFSLLSTFGSSICCCALQAGSNNAPCCQAGSTESAIKTNATDCCTAKSAHSCCSTRNSENLAKCVAGNSVPQQSAPAKHHCPCVKNKFVISQVPASTQQADCKSCQFVNWDYNQANGLVTYSIIDNLNAERNLAPCESVFSCSRELLRAYHILRC